ncbi:MAG: GerMN domain-containing protein [Lachnospiraceae bacterium]|nr:GerMN domain-containing protein [Lachnospiraceae bacterium]
MPAGNVYRIYMVNKEETKVDFYECSIEEDNQQKLLDYLLLQLQEVPQDTQYRAAIPDGVSLPELILKDETAVLNFSEDYYNLSTGGEILSRAAIVRTLTQVPGVMYCGFQIGGNALTSATGMPVGIMRADMFIDNNGKEINTEEKVTLALYFANAEGNGLVRVDRDVIYSSNIPIERLVMEQLILGVNEPEMEMGAYPVISDSTRLLSVTEKDGICYVNLDTGFMAQTLDVTPEVALYSIVNSLVELSAVNRVQFSVNGATNLVFREKYSLSDSYDRNLEIVQPAKTEEEKEDGEEQTNETIETD